MTSGWSGDAYDGIPAGAVGFVRTMQPKPPLLGAYPPAPTPGVDYYMTRGQFNYSAGGPLYDPTLYSNKATSAPLSGQCAMLEKSFGCGPTPPMDHCRSLRCPNLAYPFSIGCVGPNGPVPAL